MSERILGMSRRAEPSQSRLGRSRLRRGLFFRRLLRRGSVLSKSLLGKSRLHKGLRRWLLC